MLTIDLGSREVWLYNQLIHLTWTEFEILTLLASAPMQCLDRRDIAQEVWGRAFFDDGHALESHVSRLRKKLGDDNAGRPWITTVRKAGYRWECRGCVELIPPAPFPQIAVGAPRHDSESGIRPHSSARRRQTYA